MRTMMLTASWRAKARWSLSLAAILVALATGCAHRLPSAGFNGFTVTKFRPELATKPLRVDSITMDLELDFVVRNTLAHPLVVPPHKFNFQLGTLHSQSPMMARQVAPPNSILHIKYPVHLQLDTDADDKLKQLWGGEVPYSFSAETKLDLPELVRGALGLAGIKGDTLVLGHEGTLRLPLLPVIERTTSAPSLKFIGGNTAEVPGVRNVKEKLANLHSKLEPFVSALQRNMNRGLPRTVNGKDLLKLLVGEKVADKVVEVLGRAHINVNTGDITLPGAIPSTPLAALQHLDPNAQAIWDRFLSAWNDLDPSKYEGTLVIPTSLPKGATVTVPLRIRNPNRFPIHLPGMRVALVANNGAQLSMVQAIAREDMGKPMDQLMESFELAPGASTDLMLISEFRWDQLGSVLEGLGADKFPVQLQGEVTMDLGLGRMAVPVDTSP